MPMMPRTPMLKVFKMKRLLSLVAVTLLIYGCGQKGDLYLPGPEPTAVTVTEPAQAETNKPSSTVEPEAESSLRKKSEKSAQETSANTQQ